jgi:peptide/nickel transport system permease protein
MRNFPRFSIVLLILTMVICIIYGSLVSEIAGYMNLTQTNMPPSTKHIFGTDAFGRDIFMMICAGGRASLFIGIFATVISTAIAVIYGSVSAVSQARIDDVLMRFTEILMSIPQILLVIFLQAASGEPNSLSMTVVIGVTGWMAVAKMVRSEVRQIRNAEFVLAAKISGGGFFYILRCHFMPNFFSAIMFMVVTNIGSAIALEATLSFLGIGLAVNHASWGSLMALSQGAMLTGAWWVLLIPGTVLVVTLICITNIGEYLRLSNSREKLL